MKRSTVALVAGLLLCLSACGKAADPPPVADPTASVSPTRSGPVEPVMPDVARQLTKVGAIAFARYFLRIVDYAQRTGDTATLSKLQQPDCSACTAGRRWIERIARSGGRIDGGQHQVRRVRVVFINAKGAAISMNVVTSPQRVIGAGDLNRNYGGGRQLLTMAVNVVGGAWLIADMRFVG